MRARLHGAAAYLPLACLCAGFAIFLGATGAEWRDAWQGIESAPHSHARLLCYVRSGLWWGGVVNLSLGLVLLLSQRWWMKASPPEDSGRSVLLAPPARFWWGLLLIMTVALMVRLPRMNHGLYNDEAYNLRRYIAGDFKRMKEDDGVRDPRFRPLPWRNTFFGNWHGNNSVLFSVTARVCHDAWRGITHSPRDAFSEWVLRMPALVPGLVSILLLGMLGRSLMSGRAGILAALLCAFHPWHIRYSTEARPYGLVICLVLLGVLLLVRVARRGDWPAWVGLGAVQFLLLYASASMVYWLTLLNLGLLVHIVVRCRKEGAAAYGQLARFAVVNIGAAMVFIQLMGPNLPQLFQALNTIDSMKETPGAAYFADAPAYLLTGMPWFERVPENPWNPSLQDLPAWSLRPLAFVTAALCLAGCVRMFLRGGIARLLVLVALSAIPFTYIVSVNRGSVLHVWYLVYLVPVFCLAIAAGVEGVGGVLAKPPPRFRTAATAVATALFVLMVAHPLNCYLRQGKECMREVVETTRGVVFPFTPSERRPLVGWFWSDAYVYDPFMIRVRSTDDMKKLALQAEREDRPFFITFGHRDICEASMPEMLEFVEHPGRFELRATLPGLEYPKWTNYVYRYRNTNDRAADIDAGGR